MGVKNKRLWLLIQDLALLLQYARHVHRRPADIENTNCQSFIWHYHNLPKSVHVYSFIHGFLWSWSPRCSLLSYRCYVKFVLLLWNISYFKNKSTWYVLFRFILFSKEKFLLFSHNFAFSFLLFYTFCPIRYLNSFFFNAAFSVCAERVVNLIIYVQNELFFYVVPKLINTCPYSTMWKSPKKRIIHYSDVIMSEMASQITGVSIVCTAVCSGAEENIEENIKAPRHWPLWGEFTGD